MQKEKNQPQPQPGIRKINKRIGIELKLENYLTGRFHVPQRIERPYKNYVITK